MPSSFSNTLESIDDPDELSNLSCHTVLTMMCSRDGVCSLQLEDQVKGTISTPKFLCKLFGKKFWGRYGAFDLVLQLQTTDPVPGTHHRQNCVARKIAEFIRIIDALQCV